MPAEDSPTRPCVEQTPGACSEAVPCGRTAVSPACEPALTFLTSPGAEVSYCPEIPSFCSCLNTKHIF